MLTHAAEGGATTRATALPVTAAAEGHEHSAAHVSGHVQVLAAVQQATTSAPDELPQQQLTASPVSEQTAPQPAPPVSNAVRSATHAVATQAPDAAHKPVAAAVQTEQRQPMMQVQHQAGVAAPRVAVANAHTQAHMPAPKRVATEKRAAFQAPFVVAPTAPWMPAAAPALPMPTTSITQIVSTAAGEAQSAFIRSVLRFAAPGSHAAADMAAILSHVTGSSAVAHDLASFTGVDDDAILGSVDDMVSSPMQFAPKVPGGDSSHSFLVPEWDAASSIRVSNDAQEGAVSATADAVHEPHTPGATSSHVEAAAATSVDTQMLPHQDSGDMQRDNGAADVELNGGYGADNDDNAAPQQAAASMEGVESSHITRSGDDTPTWVNDDGASQESDVTRRSGASNLVTAQLPLDALSIPSSSDDDDSSDEEEDAQHEARRLRALGNKTSHRLRREIHQHVINRACGAACDTCVEEEHGKTCPTCTLAEAKWDGVEMADTPSRGWNSLHFNSSLQLLKGVGSAEATAPELVPADPQPPGPLHVRWDAIHGYVPSNARSAARAWTTKYPLATAITGLGSAATVDASERGSARRPRGDASRSRSPVTTPASSHALTAGSSSYKKVAAAKAPGQHTAGGSRSSSSRASSRVIPSIKKARMVVIDEDQ